MDVIIIFSATLPRSRELRVTLFEHNRSSRKVAGIESPPLSKRQSSRPNNGSGDMRRGGEEEHNDA